MLWERSAVFCISKEPTTSSAKLLTGGNDDPDEVHENEVEPEIVSLGSAVCQVLMVVIEHACGVVENIAVYLSKRYHCLKWIAERMIDGDQISCQEGKRPPAKLLSTSVPLPARFHVR